MHPLLAPARLYSRDEVLSRPSPVPGEPGVYAWYFLTVPALVPCEHVHRHKGLALLYVGISPSRPPANGKPASRQNLRKRLRYHYRGNAEGSTLRLTLGALLSSELGIGLVRVGSGNTRTFADGEHAISSWMALNAFVCWMPHPTPWVEEARLITELSLPLNLAGNLQHPFAATLSGIRSAAKARAQGLLVHPRA